MSGGRWIPNDKLEQLKAAGRVREAESIKTGLREAIANAEIVKLRRGASSSEPSSTRVVPVAAAPNMPPLVVEKPPKRERDLLPDPVEADVQREVLDALRNHPSVAWCERMNVVRKGHIKAGFVGLSDIIGQLWDGRFLAVECKRRWTNPEQAQIEFLGRVDRAKGMAFVARGGADVWQALGNGMEAA